MLAFDTIQKLKGDFNDLTLVYAAYSHFRIGLIPRPEVFFNNSFEGMETEESDVLKSDGFLFKSSAISNASWSSGKDDTIICLFFLLSPITLYLTFAKLI